MSASIPLISVLAPLPVDTSGKTLAGVYFIQRGESGPFKIGWSKSVRSRLAALQTATPERLYLRLVLAAQPVDERRLHAWFAGERLVGEWFRPDGEVGAFVANATKNDRGSSSWWGGYREGFDDATVNERRVWSEDGENCHETRVDTRGECHGTVRWREENSRQLCTAHAQREDAYDAGHLAGFSKGLKEGGDAARATLIGRWDVDVGAVKYDFSKDPGCGYADEWFDRLQRALAKATGYREHERGEPGVLNNGVEHEDRRPVVVRAGDLAQALRDTLAPDVMVEEVPCSRCCTCAMMAAADDKGVMP